MIDSYRTAAFGACLFLFSGLYMLYTNSTNHQQQLLDEEMSRRNLSYAREGSSPIPYWYITVLGCRVHVIESVMDSSGAWQKEYKNRMEQKACNFTGYYLYGPGLWLSILASVLIGLNILDVRNKQVATTLVQQTTQGPSRQKKYLFGYLFSLVAVFLLEGSAIIAVLVMLFSWGENESTNLLAGNLTRAAYVFSPLIYLVFLWYGRGMHRANLKKIVLFGLFLLVPLMVLFSWTN